MTPMYDVIIPSFNQDYRPLLQDIGKYQPNARVTVIDNGPVWRGYSNGERYYKLDSNLGFVKATNVGIAVSTAPYIVLQNDDTRIFGPVYDHMRHYYSYEAGQHWHVDDKGTVGIVGACSSPGFSWVAVNNRPEYFPQYSHLGKDAEGNYPEISLEDHAHMANNIYEHTRGQFTMAGMLPFFCVMIKREVIEKVGYLSEEFGVGLGDDDDYCQRVIKAGYKLLLALDSYVYHQQRTTFKSLYNKDELTAIHKKNLTYFKDKWGIL